MLRKNLSWYKMNQYFWFPFVTHLLQNLFQLWILVTIQVCRSSSAEVFPFLFKICYLKEKWNGSNANLIPISSEIPF